jgi:diguanylate cyclase (GGDEF)-like protein
MVTPSNASSFAQSSQAILATTTMVVAARTSWAGRPPFAAGRNLPALLRGKLRWLAIFSDIGIGGKMLRRSMGPATVLPFALFAAAAILVHAGLREIDAAALTASFAATLIFGLSVRTGWRLLAVERELRDLSLTDELTGIHNRRGFYFLGQQAVRDAQRSATGLTLFFFDLDGLKQVNDRLGHEAGSEMIRAFAAILSSTFRKSDIVGRLGGDEFAVITIRDDGMSLETVYARLDQLTQAHNFANDGAYRLSFSSGHAELNPGETLDSLVTRADGLMYRAKARKSPGLVRSSEAKAQCALADSLS